MPSNDLSNAGYADHAESLFTHYETLAFEQVHRQVLPFLPAVPSDVIDIGAGSGRDAAYLAAQGHRVVAVEPTQGLLERAQTKHTHPNISWVHDALPDLNALSQQASAFDVLLLSAVWMHLDEEERRRGMQALDRLARRASLLVMSLRHGPVPQGRRMFDVGAEETVELAGSYGFQPTLSETSTSIQAANRAQGVRWTKLVFVRSG